jgi:hypothetical protein
MNILLTILIFVATIGNISQQREIQGTWTIKTAENELGFDCSPIVFEYYQLEFGPGRTYQLQEYDYYAPDQKFAFEGTYEIREDTLELKYEISGQKGSLKYPIVRLEPDILEFEYNLCSATDSIGHENPLLILELKK